MDGEIDRVVVAKASDRQGAWSRASYGPVRWVPAPATLTTGTTGEWIWYSCDADHDVQLCSQERQDEKFTCSELLAGDYNGAVWARLRSHDYDLDLFLFGKQSRLMRNQGSAGFADRTADFLFCGESRQCAAIRSQWIRIARHSTSACVECADGSAVIYRDELNGRYRVR